MPPHFSSPVGAARRCCDAAGPAFRVAPRLRLFRRPTFVSHQRGDRRQRRRVAASLAPEPRQPALQGALQRLQGLLLAYDRALHSRPVITKALTSFIGFALGDYLAQGITAAAFDPLRCLRLSLYGLLIDGPIGHLWYRLLDKHVCPEAPTSTRAVLAKTAWDQLVWGPGMTVVFFAFLKTLEGRPDLILHTVQTKLVKVVAANYMVWPLAHLVNFKWVPSEYRILFNNVVSVAWNAWMSLTCAGTASPQCNARVAPSMA